MANNNTNTSTSTNGSEKTAAPAPEKNPPPSASEVVAATQKFVRELEDWPAEFQGRVLAGVATALGIHRGQPAQQQRRNNNINDRQR